MTGTRYKPLQRPMRKVQYVEVKRKRGLIFKEVTVQNSPLSPSHASRTPVKWPDAPADFGNYDTVPPYTTSTKTSNDYIREWIPRRNQYLDTMLEGEGRPQVTCSNCMAADASWRCTECLGKPVFCIRCCREIHHRCPLHRVEQWTGSHWATSWLINAGVEIHLGHNGAKCPNSGVWSQCSLEAQDDEDEDEWEDDNIPPAGESLDGAPSSEALRVLQGAPGIPTLDRGQVLNIVDVTGLHQLVVRPCRCPDNSDSDDIQLLRMALFPASFTIFKTAFTIRVLDDFRHHNLGCNTTAYQYYNKIRRVTSPAFPHTVLNRYRELIRVYRQYRNLKYRKWHGFGHCKKEPQPGELALFCAACPQPGINLPATWSVETDQVKYTRALVLDGNFKLAHVRQKRPEDDVWLADGHGMMAEEGRYKEHIATALEEREKHTCSAHRAVLDKNMHHGGLDHTGIGAAACAAHGAFAPTSVVNFQKGERQMNMDYSLCQALKATNVGDIEDVITYYDINCTFSKNFGSRVQRNPYLHVEDHIKITPGIGLLHVTEHKPECSPRYAPTFIRGAGLVAGEIIESLWSGLIGCSSATRTASAANRAETLDDHMNDSNWGKLVNIVETVSKRYVQAKKGLPQRIEDLEERSLAAGPENVKRWTQQVERAELGRSSKVDVMDIYLAEKLKAPSRSDVHLSQLAGEQASAEHLGVSSWLASGLRIEEAQIAIRAHIRRLKGLPSNADRLDLARRRERLRHRIESFNQSGLNYLRGINLIQEALEETAPLDDEASDDEENPFVPTYAELFEGEPESQPLLLPSTVGKEACIRLRLTEVMDKEIGLREGQANDALEGLRQGIGEKSFMFRARLRHAKGKMATRARSSILAVGRALNNHRRVYGFARRALISLGAEVDNDSIKYKPVTLQDLRASTTIYDPSAPRQRNTRLAWFWGSSVQDQTPSNNVLLTEFYRVHWLNARAKYMRWKEQVEVTTSEMEWTTRFFLFKAHSWSLLHDQLMAGGMQCSAGHICYAERQRSMWEDFAAHAQAKFQTINSSYVVL